MVTVRYFASARAAAGVAEETWDTASLEELLAGIAERHGSKLGAIIAASSLLLDGERVINRRMMLPPSAELEVLPPFAGG